MKEKGKAKAKKRLGWGAVIVLGAVALGFGVAASGVIPIEASSEHWPITAWFLHFSMRRSVATHSIGTDPPPLDDPALLRLGAGHFEGGCRMCHGAPGHRMPPIPHGMTPHPPWLPPRVESMDPAGLHYTVRHGVKFTGMPAWPAVMREDEPWAVVAFLVELRDMEPARYRSLVTAEGSPLADAPPWTARMCARCHGHDGLGRDGTAPVLAGQRRAYLLASLEAYAAGERHSGFMQPMAARLTEPQMREAARWYASLPGLEEEMEPDATPGALIALRGIPARRIPSCAPCHGPSEHRRNENFPLLRGQHPRWIERQLEAFVHGTRGGSEWVELMQPVIAHDLGEDEREAVARFYGRTR